MAELVGAASLPEAERLTIRTAGLLRRAVLQQSSLSPNDAHCSLEKQAALLELVLGVHAASTALLEGGVALERIEAVDLSAAVRARDETPADGAGAVRQLAADLRARLEAVE
jgi:V/A-type H+-transporting ATPase subunit A